MSGCKAEPILTCGAQESPTGLQTEQSAVRAAPGMLSDPPLAQGGSLPASVKTCKSRCSEGGDSEWVFRHLEDGSEKKPFL